MHEPETLQLNCISVRIRLSVHAFVQRLQVFHEHQNHLDTVKGWAGQLGT